MCGAGKPRVEWVSLISLPCMPDCLHVSFPISLVMEWCFKDLNEGR